MKDVLAAAGVPTARHRTFGAGDEGAALAFLETLPGRYVVKTDGLAAGKGVVVTESLAEARDAVRAYLSGDAFGDAGRTCVIEEGLTGPSCRCSCCATARDALPFAAAQDHKRAFDGDEGPNTGGMGAYSPVPFVPADLVDEVMEQAIRPTLDELRRRGAEFRGRPLLRPDAHPGRARRCSSTTCASATPSARCVVPRLASDLYVHCRESAVGPHRDAGRAARRRVRRRRRSRPRAIRPRRPARATSSRDSTPRPRSRA